MTPFHHESRPRLANGLPCWLGTNIELPSVDLRSEARAEDGMPTWTVLIMVGNHGGSSWAIRDFPHRELFELLTDWEAGPEEALKRWFDREPPSGTSRGPLIEDELAAGPRANKTAEDLGL